MNQIYKPFSCSEGPLYSRIIISIIHTACILSDREYTAREQGLLMRCINLIQGRLGGSGNTISKGDGTILMQPGQIQADASPSGDEGCIDMNMSYISGNSIDLCSPDRIDMPNGWEAPAPPAQPILQPLRLYVPELEEIRISPVVARKGNVINLILFIATDAIPKLQFIH